MTNKDIINNEITKNSAKTPGVGETGGVAPVLTIDGPSGSGKGTVAQRVASHLGWHLLDSGAIYRVLAYRALRDGVALDDVAGLCASAVEMTLSFDSHGMLPVPVCLDGEWVTSALRTESVAKAASQVAALAPVREKLLDRQRDFCQFPGLVADGRDMGTVVFPTARAKVYLTASVQARVDRRVQQLWEKQLPADPEDIRTQIEARDAQDMNRATAPLKPADDAVMIDSTTLSIDEVFQRVMAVVQPLLTST